MPFADSFFFSTLRFGNDDDYVLNRFLSHLPFPQCLSNPFSTPFTPVSFSLLLGLALGRDTISQLEDLLFQ